MKRVAFFSEGRMETHQPYYDAFREGMRKLGYVEGRNVEINAFWGDDTIKPLRRCRLFSPSARTWSRAGSYATWGGRAATSPGCRSRTSNKLSRVGVLYPPDDPGSLRTLEQLGHGAAQLGIEIVPIEAWEKDKLIRAFKSFRKYHVEARRVADRATNEIRVRGQLEDSEGARSRNPAIGADPGR